MTIAFKSKLLKHKNGIDFMENNCTITIDGKSFTSGGSWLMQNKETGKYHGILYANPTTNEVTSWDGKLRIHAYFGKSFRNNFGANMQSVWFTYNGMKFYGLRGIDWRQDIKSKTSKLIYNQNKNKI